MAEENENGEQQAKKKPSKLKFIILGLIILILLVVILVVVYTLVLAPKGENTDQAAAQTQTAQAQMPVQAPQAAAPMPMPAPAPAMGGGMDMAVSNAEMGQIYPIPAMNVNLADPTGITYLSVSLALEFDPKNADLNAEIEAKMPRIEDMIITVLSSKAYEEISTSQGKINLKNEFLRRINSMLAKGRLYNVYITSFVVQRG